MQDIHVLKILETRSNYSKYSQFIRPYALSKYARQVFHDIKLWYDNNPDVDCVDWEGFSEWFRIIQHSTYDEELTEIYAKLLSRLHSFDTEDVTYEQIVQGFIERDCASKMVEFLMGVVEGEAPAKHFKKLNVMLTSYDEQIHRVTEQEESLVDESIEELLASTVGGEGLNWRLPELNISVGPARVGNNIMIAAAPDTGKTTLALSEMSYMLPQLPEDKECIYFCNEESGKQNKVRCIQALVGATNSEILTNPAEVAAKYNQYVVDNGEKFKFYWNTNMSTRFIEETIRQHNPGLIFIDQLWNVEGFGDAGTSTEMYTALARWVRRIAAVAPTISLHQADGTAYGEKWLEMNQLYGSKIGMQGAMDAIITVGRPFGSNVEDTERGLYVPKNKLPGGPPPYDATQKYQRWTVFIDPTKALYNSGL